MFRADDGKSLSLLYHLNSEPWRVPDGNWRPQFREPAGATEPLPHPASTEWESLLKRRRSVREFGKGAVTPAELAALLRGAYGAMSETADRSGRGVPSAGALYPLEIYCIGDAGIRRYLTREHALETVAPQPAPGALARCYLGQPCIGSAAELIVMTAVFGRNQDKYGPRGYRYSLFEAGHVAQTLCLLAQELELNSVCLGGFSDTLLNQLLGIDGVSEAALYSVAIGRQITAEPET